jgi:hypothetical protein
MLSMGGPSVKPPWTDHINSKVLGLNSAAISASELWTSNPYLIRHSVKSRSSFFVPTAFVGNATFPKEFEWKGWGRRAPPNKLWSEKSLEE